MAKEKSRGQKKKKNRKMETRSGVFAVAITVLLLIALTMNSVSAESKAKVKLGPSDTEKVKLNHSDAAKENLNHTDAAKWKLNHSDAAKVKLNHSDVAKEELNHSDAAKENLNYTDAAKVALNPSESMTFPTERALNELIYDDGTAEDAYAWSSAGNGFAVQFTPPTYPVDLRTARICFWPDWPDSNHEEFAVYVYDDDGPGGEPGTCLGGPIFHTATAWGWCDVDISGPGITIENGDLYILYKQLTDDPDCEGLCRDLSLPQYERSWDYVGGSWDLWNAENYMIRCVVDDDTTDCGNMGVNPTSWSPTLNCGESDNEIVTVSATDGTVKGVTVSKVSGPTWLSVSPTNLGDIASGSSKTFTMTAAPPSEISGDFPYTVRVSNTCGTPSTRDVSGTIHVDCPEPSWTFMVYLDGDNNLEFAAIDDFLEMSSVSSTTGINIVVQFDRIDGYSSAYDDWKTCKRFHVTSGMTPTAANATEDLGECNMGNPNTLDAFVTWAMTDFPADNYALVLWNHGDGWKSINNWVPWADDDIKDAKDAGLSRGICVDNTNNDYLSLQETEDALTGKYVQLLGYDACLMHMIEVVYQVMANAGVSVGSEEVEPWDGWPYNTILADLTGMPTMNEDALATVIVDRYMDSYGYTGSKTQSAMDNSALPNLVAAVDNLAQALINEINAGHVAEVQQARNAAAEIYYTYYIDLYHFAEMVDTYVPGAAAQAQAVMNEVSSSMYEAHGTSVPNDHGLSIYYPRYGRGYLASYDSTAFASDTQWNEFLKEYYAPTICGNMNVNPTSWSTTLNCGESDNEIVTVSASGGTVKGVTVSKVSGPTWLSVSPTDLGDIASGSSKTFTMTTSPPSGTSGDFPYSVRVSNTCGTPSTRDVSGTINVSCPCGNMGVNPTSWSPTLNCSESDNEIVTVSASDNIVNGVTVSKVSGPTWLSVSPTDLGDIASGSSKTFTMTTSPPSGTSGDFPYSVRVSNTCGTPSTRDVSGTINVSCPCGNMGVNPTSWSPTLNCSESDNEIVTVSASDNIVNGVTVSKVSGPTWLSVSPTDLGDIASGSSKTFTMTTSPPSGTSGDFPYSVRVSNTCGTPSTRDVSGTINVSCPCGNMGVNPTSWSPTLNCSESDNEIVTVSASDNIVNGVTVSKVSGPTWLSVSPTDLGDIASGSSKTFTMTTSPPSGTSGDFPYSVRVSNTCGTPSTRDVSGTINVSCPCGNMGVNPTSWSPTLNCSESDNEIVTVSASDNIVNGVTVSKVSGPTWLSVSPTDLGDIASGSSKTFTMTTSPPSGTSGDFPYSVRVSNTCGTPSTRDVSGTINVSCPCGNMGVNPTSWSPTLNCSESDNEIVTVSASDNIVNGVTVSKVSGPTWLSVSPTDLGDIASGSSKTFTMTTSPPSGTSGDFPYTITVSNTCGTPSTRDVAGTINVSCPCGNMGVNSTSWSPTLNCSESDNEIVTVSASDNIVNGVTVSKVSGPTWLSVSPTDLGDIASGSSKTFTMTTSPPSGTSGDFPYSVRVSNTCGTPSTRDVSGTINVSCPCGNMGVNSTSWSPTLNCSESDNEIVTVSASDNIVNGVTVSKVSGPTWLSVSPTDLGDIASGSSKAFTMTTSPPSGTSGDFPYTITVSNTCGSPSSRDVAGTIHVDYPESSWTFMIYLDGDNNLESAAIGDFLEMSSVGSSPTVNIVVQFDRIPGYVSSYGDWRDCKRFHVTSGMTPTAANATEDLGECNMGDPNTLRDFVDWAMTNFSADNYALIIWNHGDGWKSINRWVPWAADIKDAKDAGLSRGICEDNTNNDYLSLQETEQALTGKYVQLLGYDACLMHMIEVVYQVMTNAGVSVGSEEVEPGDGWPYDTILADLTVTPTMNEYVLGTVIVDRYMASYPTRNDLTQSAMANSALPNLVTAVDNLAQALMTEINAGHVADVQQARNAAAEIYYTYYIDLYHFAEKVQLYVPGATAQAQAVMNAVSGSMYEAHGTSVPNDHGLSIYFPRVEGDYLASYDNTAFASDTKWDDFLKKYYNPPTQGADIAVFRNGAWHVDTNRDQVADIIFGYGIPGDVPIVGDINQDGTDDTAIYRDGAWHVDTNRDQVADIIFGYGIPGDVPIVGDINQDGTDDTAIYRDGAWHVDTNRDQVADIIFGYGIPGDVPIVGDINQDGTDDTAIYRDGAWHVDTNRDQVADIIFGYGIPGDVPIVGDINQDGTDDRAIYRDGAWHVDTNRDQVADIIFGYGIAGDVPVAGGIG